MVDGVEFSSGTRKLKVRETDSVEKRKIIELIMKSSSDEVICIELDVYQVVKLIGFIMKIMTRHSSYGKKIWAGEMIKIRNKYRRKENG
jgi:hypothetical protein